MQEGGTDSDASRSIAAPSHSNPVRISADDVSRAARGLVAAYGPAAGDLMRGRMRAVRRRGDAEIASLWHAVAQAVKRHLAAGRPAE